RPRSDDVDRNQTTGRTHRSLPPSRSPASWSNQCRRLKGQLRVSSAIAAKLFIAEIFVGVFGPHGERNSSARGELRGHDRLAWPARFHKIVQDAVRDRFVEGTLVPIRGKIKLERLAFDAELIRHVIDIDPGEIRLTRDRTNGSEIIRFEMNPVI